MHKTKTLLFVIIVISIMLGGCSCMSNYNQYSTSFQIQTAKELLNNKYDEDFEVSAIGQRYGTLSNSTYKVTCYPINHPELVFMAEISKDGSYIYDEYISKIVCNELTNDIVQKTNFNAEFFIASRPSVFETSNKNITLDELVKLNDNTDFVIWMVCNNNIETSKMLEELNDVFSSYQNLNGELRFYITNDDNTVKQFGKMAKKCAIFDSNMTMILADIEEQKIEIKNSRIDY